MLALTNVKILNGHKDMKPVSNKAILINDDKIADIVDDIKIPNDVEIIDLGGHYLMPGLINLHVHLPSGGKPTKKKLDYEKIAKLLKLGTARAVVRKMCEKLALQELMSGTTTIRAVGGVLDVDTRLRNQINDGKKIGPRILASDWAISVPGGHMTGSVALPAHSIEEVVSMVHELDKNKPDLIKLMITGGVLDADVPGEPGVLRMPPEYVKAACDEAHKLGYQVAAHVESQEGMIVALKNGVDTLEHGGKPSQEVLDLLKKTGSVVVATISPVLPILYVDNSVSEYNDTDRLNANALKDYMISLYKECIKNDIPVGLGTDTGCPYVAHYDMWRELWYYCKYCDVSPAFALYSATLLNAKIAHIDNITGSVDVGKSADFLVCKNNPLEDLSVLRNPSKVFFRGQLIDNPKVKKYENVEQALDAIM